eukprot:CAMPEP_0118930660 /NCGR_PEP_ID=MMETSP1169-20130426/7269_1 /TAXON_ID=36882 /ORGANISM="Pyramimonas obovata, Strain CCMP722" /LENGTH=1698 /DNA_ID=CAMNT_0006873045 /DNA_START=1 /DNA_END=5097 /DNA_ORIENTATION=+
MPSTKTRRWALLVCLLTSGVDDALGVGRFFNPRVHRARTNSRAADGFSAGRRLTQQATSDTTLRVHFEHSVLTSDTATCHEEGAKVRRGKPKGCGLGCQYASTVTAVSSSYFPSGANQIRGPPDQYPKIGTTDRSNPRTWSPALENSGLEFIQFTIESAVYVASVEIYETFHPGAVYEIEGRIDQNDIWDVLWKWTEGTVPAGSSVYDPDSGQTSSTARVFKPDLSAPRSKRLGEFRLKLNTTMAAGWNEIDAVRISGDDDNGRPVDARFPNCNETLVDNCWYQCQSQDILTLERFNETLNVVSKAVGWLGKALKVAPPEAGRLTLPPLEGNDPDFNLCGDVNVPQTLRSKGVAAELVLLVTNRPTVEYGFGPFDRSLLYASACRFDTSTVSEGRPVAMHLNMPPLYAFGASMEGQEGIRDAVDGVIHWLYKALGWGPEFHSKFPGYNEETTVVQCPNSAHGTYNLERGRDCRINENGAQWDQRDRLQVTLPKIRQWAGAHFGDSLDYVEFENVGRVYIDDVRYEQNVRGILLEDRIFNGEIMTYPAVGKRLYRSAISLALLEDTGWYFPNYDVAEELPWGKGQGRSFFNLPCNLMPLSAKHYVCPTNIYPLQGKLFDLEASTADVTLLDTGAPALACTGDRTAKGKCSVQEWESPLAGPYQYFQRPDESNFGGTNSLQDFCPWTELVTEGDCTNAANAENGAFKKYFEEFGPSARCFDVDRENVKQIGCLRHQCSEGKLYLKFNSSYAPCPVSGGEVFNSELGITVTCPPAAELCDAYPFMSPTIAVNFPEKEKVYTPFITAEFELTNFQVPTDGEVRVSINGRLHEVWLNEDSASTDSGLSFIKRVALRPLPEGRFTLEFSLYSYTTDTEVANAKVVINVKTEETEWATEFVDFSSEDPQHPIGHILSVNTTNLYGSSVESWSPASGGKGLEFVELKIPRALHFQGVSVWENFSPALRSVFVINTTSGLRIPMWSGTSKAAVAPNVGEYYAPTTVTARPPIPGLPVTKFPTPIKTDTFRLEFITPSWVEVDAVEVQGVTLTPPLLSAHDAEQMVVTVRKGEVKIHIVQLRQEGSATLYWELEDWEDYPAWLQPINATGVQFGDGVIDVQFLVNASKLTGAAGSVPVNVVNTFETTPGRKLLQFNLDAQVDYSVIFELPPPLCYHGVVVNASRFFPGECRCHVGAYGQSCEFLHCPKNCSISSLTPVFPTPPSPLSSPPDPAVDGTESDSSGNEADGAVDEAQVQLRRGVCDIYTGQCQCTAGYSGYDCSAQDGDCYVSFDGSCRGGWESGSYIINSEDSMNLNKAAGAVPASMQCTGGSEYEFGCKKFVTMQFCCRPTKAAECPFHEEAAPCDPSMAHCFGNYNSDPACLSAVQAYCFEFPGDPGCNSFMPVPVPATYCPDGLALEYCVAHPEDKQACADLIAPSFASCAFNASSSVCSVAACRANVLSEECIPHVAAYCEEHPEDRECDLYGFGDDCLFLPNSAPCVASACNVLPDAYDVRRCDRVIEDYCASSQGPQDPECANQGYGDPPTEFKPQHRFCPWDAIRKQCAADPAAPACLQMHMTGTLASTAASSLPTKSQLQREVQDKYFDAYDNFLLMGKEESSEQRVNKKMLALTDYLWTTANLNGDSTLTSDEFDLLRQTAQAVLRLDQSVADSADFDMFDALLESYSYGKFITYDQLNTVVQSYFKMSNL